MEWNNLQKVTYLYSGHLSTLPIFIFLIFKNFGFDDFSCSGCSIKLNISDEPSKIPSFIIVIIF